MSAFLSTLSLRRATAYFFYVAKANNFYPRSPCGERLKAPKVTRHMRKISIHALLAESDQYQMSAKRDIRISIHALLAESDNNGGGVSAVYFISIHALLAESDRRFSSRRPFVGRFLSTLSLRRATAVSSPRRVVSKFLSTLSLRRATRASQSYSLAIIHFYPRSPCGERPPTRAL